jgi:[ribosomal protein S5]-alanine N-acetyltransferase
MSITIRMPRLDLVAALPEVARAESLGLPDWFAPLGVAPPPVWPPPLNDHDSMGWFARSIARDPEGLGWFGWYALLRGAAGAPPALAGNCGFKGRPDTRGSVEIGYSLLVPHQRRGLGTELVAGLVEWAFSHRAVERVLAETYPDFVASARVLEKNGFRPVGRGSSSDLIRFELRRAVFELRARTAGAAALPEP